MSITCSMIHIFGILIDNHITFKNSVNIFTGKEESVILCHDKHDMEVRSVRSATWLC